MVAFIAPDKGRDVPTIIEFLLDETGSMRSCKSQVISGFNSFLNEQRDTDGLCLLSLTKFDSSGLKTPFVDIDVGMVPHLTTNTFQPDAMTNLRDAIVARIHHLENRLKTWDIKPRVLFVAMTDGGDNFSGVSVAQTKEQIQKVSDQGWTCVYLGSNDGAGDVAKKLGFPEGNIKSFETTEMHSTMVDLSRATQAYRSMTVSTQNFFNQEGI